MKNVRHLGMFDSIFICREKGFYAMNALENNPKINAVIKLIYLLLFSCLVPLNKIELRLTLLFEDCGGWIRRSVLLPVQSIINAVIDNTSRVTVL